MGGVLFDKSQATLVEYPSGLSGSYAIPAGVTTIDPDAMAFCINLTHVTIPASVTNIGLGAFQDSSELTSAIFLGKRSDDGSQRIFE